MDCCGQCQPTFPQTKELLSYLFCLKIASLFLVLVGLSKIFISDYNGLLNDFIVLVVIVVIVLCLDYYMSALLIFLYIFNIFHSMIFVGLRIQNTSLKITDKFTSHKFLLIGGLIIQSISIVFYILMTVLTFYIYKEIRFCKLKAEGDYRK